MPNSASRPSPSPRLKRSHLLLGAGLALAATGGVAYAGRTHPGVMATLERARPARVFSARLSIATPYRPCTVRTRPGETVPRDACGAPNEYPAELDALETAAGSTDPDSLQASALLAMVAGEGKEQSLDRAIEQLGKALLVSPRQVPLLVDLSGAHLFRAQRAQAPRDLLAGLEYALEALEREPRNTAALFNTALALDALAADDQARLAWNAYLRVDSTSAWAEEAKRRRSAPRQAPAATAATSPKAGASPAAVRAYAERYPREARLLGLDTVLGQWGDSLLAGRTAAAADLLQLAERLGASLVAAGGDASLLDAVGAIRTAEGDSAVIRDLARAHRAYAAGQALLGGGPASTDSFAKVVRMRPRSPALVRSAEVFVAGGLAWAEKNAAADSAFRALLPRVDSVRYPGLAARAVWMQGTAQIRDSRFVEARATFMAAHRLFARAKETEYAASMWVMAGEAAHGQRDTLAAYPLMHRGVLAMRGYRSSLRLHNALLVLANCAITDGMPRAAFAIQDEDVAVAMRLKGFPAVEALAGRARANVAWGRRKAAARDVASATTLVQSITDSVPRAFMEAKVNSTRALLVTDGSSGATLDSALAFFDKGKNPAWFLPVLLQRADARLARGDLAGATADLDTATARIRRLSQTLGDASLRVAVVEQAHGRFDKLVMLHARAGRPVDALRALERGRVSFAPWAPADSLPSALATAPAGHVAVEYALIGDTLLTWIVRGSDVRLLGLRVDRRDFLRTIERVGAVMESSARAEAPEADLARLYDLLIRPFRTHLGAAETPLLILADGEVAAVPFAVLLDSRRHRYLLEDHSVRLAATLADANRPGPPVDAARAPLLVADPDFEVAQFPMLDRLRGAQAEVDALAAVYPRSLKLSGSLATRDAFVANAPRASLIHYAGHAVFDDARPERSLLVLTGAGESGRLTAEAVSSLRLNGVRLVVLSACRTVRSREGRSGGFAGFSGALLAAGAGGVLGSLWEVDDRQTQPLMVAFHRAYQRKPGDPAGALRDAQLEMLRTRPAGSSFAAWAGFRYIGR